MCLTVSLTLGELWCETAGLQTNWTQCVGEQALACDCRPRGDSETSVAFLEVAAVERLRDLVCLATGVDIVEDETGSCKLLWEICGWLDELIAILLRA